MLASRPGDVTDPPPVELRGRVRRPRRAPGAHGAGRGGAGAVRGGGPGAGVPIVQAAALLPRAVVVGHDPAACRLRVLARTRPSDLMLLDHDPAVVGIASQPFWLFWQHDGKLRSHAPDYFARRADGSAVVVDCRPLTPDQAEGCRCVRNHPPGRPRGRLGHTGLSAPRIRCWSRTCAGWLATAIRGTPSRRSPRRFGRPAPFPGR